MIQPDTEIYELWSWRGLTGRYLTLTFPKNAPAVIVNGHGAIDAAGIVTASYTPEEFEACYKELILPTEGAHRQQQIDELKEQLALRVDSRLGVGARGAGE